MRYGSCFAIMSLLSEGGIYIYYSTQMVSLASLRCDASVWCSILWLIWPGWPLAIDVEDLKRNMALHDTCLQPYNCLSSIPENVLVLSVKLFKTIECADYTKWNFVCTDNQETTQQSIPLTSGELEGKVIFTITKNTLKYLRLIVL